MSLSVLKDIRKIYSNLDPDRILEQAHCDLRVGLHASTDEGFREILAFLLPPSMPEAARVRSLRRIDRFDAGQPAEHFDFVLCEPGIPMPPNGLAFQPSAETLTAKAILSDNQALELALARNFPVFRPVVSSGIVNRISRENAFFALITALPNVVPSVLDLPWAVGEFATDTAFLTMNQIRMALILAAIHDHPVGYGAQKAQIAAIAGGAFGWRALARELVGKIPLGGGLIPKSAIAFAGTWMVGMGLEKLHRSGLGMSKTEKREVYAHGLEQGREVARELAPAFTKTATKPTPAKQA